MPNDNFYGVLESRNIDYVQVGDLEYQTWYGNSLYFGNDCKTLGFQYSYLSNKEKKVIKNPPFKIWLNKLYICEYCFKYTDDQISMFNHQRYCRYSEKFPGKIKYFDDNYTIRKIKGSRHELFCQNLCLFSKLFLDSKSVFFSVENFDFYVIYGKNDQGYQIPMGYFSKEILQCFDENNLGCICVFPPYQQRKLGTLLIAFSYELSKFQGLISGPEHPLSTFGRISYINFWSKKIAFEFLKGSFQDVDNITIDEISRFTGFRHDDILAALNHMKALNFKIEGLIKLKISKRELNKWVDSIGGMGKLEKVFLNTNNLLLE